MIYNLWSTPRTGSVWYSIKLLIELRRINPKAQLLSEFFNPYHLGIYKLRKSSSILNLSKYESGAFYEDYLLDSDNELQKKQVFAERVRSTQDEELYRLSLVKKMVELKIPLVIHNHVYPLNPDIYHYLFSIASKNIFIGRRNILDQVTSYSVAYASKVFAQFSEENISETMSNIQIDEAVISNLLSRIEFWHKLDKSKSDIVYYEDIDFNQHQEFAARLPRKQNISSALNKLSVESQVIIKKLVDKSLLNLDRT